MLQPIRQLSRNINLLSVLVLGAQKRKEVNFSRF